MTRRTPESTLTETLFPDTTLFRSGGALDAHRRENRHEIAAQCADPVVGPQPGFVGRNAKLPERADPMVECRPVGCRALDGIGDAGADKIGQVARAAAAPQRLPVDEPAGVSARGKEDVVDARSEEHTSELQSLMRISYAVFCLKK